MTLLVSGVRGLTMMARLGQLAVSLAGTVLIGWTYARQHGLGEEVVAGLKSLARLPLDLLGLTAVPGGEHP